MIVLALSTNEVLWWVSLGAGLIVAIVVWALLEILRRSVNEVDAKVGAAWEAGKLLAQNTAAAHTLQTTKVRGVELLEEVERHRSQRRSGT